MRRVLVVEDEESFSDALSYMLRRQGFEVAVCPTGPEALEALDHSGADLVLLDLMLHRPPGAEVRRALRERSDVPMIMLTDGGEDPTAGLGRGADDHVSKPFSWHELLARIRVVLGPEDQARQSLPAAPGAARIRPDVDGQAVAAGGLRFACK